MDREDKFTKQMAAYKNDLSKEPSHADETIQYGYNRGQA